MDANAAAFADEFSFRDLTDAELRDALESEPVIDRYPAWVGLTILFGGSAACWYGIIEFGKFMLPRLF